MTTALEIAHRLLAEAAADEVTSALTHLHLQKLLYYVQGWSLALRGRPMFPSPIEAWVNGPVVREVYPQFTEHGCAPIDIVPPPTESMAEEDRRFISAVWQAYREYSTADLWEMTTTEPPFVETRRRQDAAETPDSEIPLSLIAGFFGEQAALGKGRLIESAVHPRE